MVPIQSSFAKPQTPTDVGKIFIILATHFPLYDSCMDFQCIVGLVQHKVVVWIYFALELSIPAVLYSALSYDGSLVSMLVSPNFST